MHALLRCDTASALLHCGGVALLLLPLCAAAQFDTSSPWPKWAGDNRNTGRAVKSLPSSYTGPRVRWTHELLGSQEDLYPEFVERGITVAWDGKVIVPTGIGRLVCLDAATGDPTWEFRIDGFKANDRGTFARGGTPALVVALEDSGIETGGIPVRPYDVVFGCKDKLYCLRPQPIGAPLVQWRLEFRGPLPGGPNPYYTESCPAVRHSDGRMYVPVYDLEGDAPGMLIAIERNGSEVWRVHLDADDGPGDYRYDNPDLSNPAIGPDGTIYVTTIPGGSLNVRQKNGTLYAIRDLGRSGEIRWRYRPDFDGAGPGYSVALSSPSVGDDGTVYFGTWDLLGGLPGDPNLQEFGTLWAVREQNGQPYDHWHASSVAGRRLGMLEGSPTIDPAGDVYVGTGRVNSDPDLPGVFVKFSGSPPTGQILDVSPGNPADPGGHSHVDATPCLALSASGALLRVFQTMEVGRGSGVGPDGSILWSFGPSNTISETLRRADLISVAMGRDGTIYVGTRGAYGVSYPPNGRISPGWVYALWGFEQ